MSTGERRSGGQPANSEPILNVCQKPKIIQRLEQRMKNDDLWMRACKLKHAKARAPYGSHGLQNLRKQMTVTVCAWCKCTHARIRSQECTGQATSQPARNMSHSSCNNPADNEFAAEREHSSKLKQAWLGSSFAFPGSRCSFHVLMFACVDLQHDPCACSAHVPRHAAAATNACRELRSRWGPPFARTSLRMEFESTVKDYMFNLRLLW